MTTRPDPALRVLNVEKLTLHLAGISFFNFNLLKSRHTFLTECNLPLFCLIFGLKVVLMLGSLENAVCDRKDKAAGTQFLPSPCDMQTRALNSDGKQVDCFE